LVGGFIFTIFGLTLPPSLSGGVTLRWSDIVVSFIGAVIVLALSGLPCLHAIRKREHLEPAPAGAATSTPVLRTPQSP
jgi:ABC-type antimicrobial peptide transport system permease subunit